MKLRSVLVLLISHAVVAALGFAIGIYTLPLLIAPTPPSTAQVQANAGRALHTAQFRRDLKGSDALHWGEGKLVVGPDAITLLGKLAPGPDYKLYLSPRFVETEAEVEALKAQMLRVGDVKTFSNFIVPLPPGVDVEKYDTVLVWCESFHQFITAAKYR
ncbi:MAG TPA: DM13 domain-containing protein [Ramlibacter sp.]|nr:DM13 domain-containing protein [Ramlibacter sp.]